MPHIQPASDLESAFRAAASRVDFVEGTTSPFRTRDLIDELRNDIIASDDRCAEYRAIAVELTLQNRELRKQLEAALSGIPTDH